MRLFAVVGLTVIRFTNMSGFLNEFNEWVPVEDGDRTLPSNIRIRK